MKLTKHHLVEAGWQDSPQLDTIYQHALDLIAHKHITDMSYLCKHLKRDFPGSHGSLTMHSSAAPLAKAIQADTPEEIKNLRKAESQMTELLKCPVILSGTLMPDTCPAGNAPATIPVGGAIAVDNAIIPAAHSSDICCSLHASFFQSDLPVSELMDALQASTRFGAGGRDEPIHHPVLDEDIWENRFLNKLQPKAQIHMADQGDGNHFASIGEMQITPELLESLAGHGDLSEQLASHASVKVLVTHHGSRGLGAALYQRGLDAAIKHTRQHAKGIPDEAAWLSMHNQEGQDYWQALQYIARWTLANHQSIHSRFLSTIDSPEIASIGNQHNFVWKHGSHYLHGKGATPAWNDEAGLPLLGLIPLNMSAPILLTLGANNQDYLAFSPHGAGRNVARKALFRRYERKRQGFDIEAMQDDITSSTQNIDMRWYLGQPDVTECDIAYKSAEKIRQQIETYQLAEVIAEITPLGCIMAGRAPKTEKPLTPKQLRQIQHRADRRKTRQRNWHSENTE